jgi:16S rRNA (adenine1518-N6/adenine1519-N6)-dimethyltransferase
VDLCHPEFISGSFSKNNEIPKQVRDDNLKYKLIANIPYYITGEITKRFLTATHKPECIVLLVQKEVADRIADSKETILSLSVKVFGTPKKVMTVKKEYFSPSPKVDSAIVKISNIQTSFKNKEEEERFFLIIKKAFGQKRKKINTTLKEYKEQISQWDEIKDKRPEELDVEKWKKIILG